MRAIFSMVPAAAVALLAGCASSYPPPTQSLAEAQAAHRSATELGGASLPTAQLHLRLAEEGMAQAKAAMAEGDHKRATYLLVRARSDAELAIALTRETVAKNEAQQVVNELNKLRTSTAATQGANQ